MNAESRISKQTAPEAKDQQAVQELTRLLSRRRDLLVETRGEPVAPQLLMTPLNRAAKGSADHVQGILLTERPGELASTMANAPFNGAVLGLSDTPRSERKDIGREPAVITASPERVIDHIRRENVDVSNVNTLVIEEATEDPAGYYTDVQYILSKVRKHPRTILFANNASTVTGSEMTILRRPLILRPFEEEESPMGKKNYIDKPDELKKQIEDVLHAIHNDEDPLELNEYKRFFKKHVPVFRRAYFTAYLLKYLGNQSTGGGSRRQSRRQPRPSNNGNGDADMTSVFIGIGKNRRVFPRDLVALFTEVDGITGDDIGQIKILDNYSFMEIKQSQAQAAIDAVNGREFRGRKLNVNYARRKD